jgi:hypothetical protein
VLKRLRVRGARLIAVMPPRQTCRGLLVRAPHCNLFFDSENTKTWEIRSFAPPKLLKPGDDIYILESGTGGAHAPVVGSVKFVRAIQLDDDGSVNVAEFATKFEFHRVSNDTLADMRKRWKGKSLWAWEFSDPRQQHPPRAVKKSSQEVWVNISEIMWVDLHVAAGAADLALHPVQPSLSFEESGATTAASTPTAVADPSSSSGAVPSQQPVVLDSTLDAGSAEVERGSPPDDEVHPPAPLSPPASVRPEPKELPEPIAPLPNDGPSDPMS